MTKDSPMSFPRITPYVLYEDVAGAMAWLEKAFGFTERLRYEEPDGNVSHAEMELQDGVVMLGYPGPDYRNPKHSGHVNQTTFVIVDDVDKHHEIAAAAGAEILAEPLDKPYGMRSYAVRDLEGHRWDFAQQTQEVRPEDWGAKRA